MLENHKKEQANNQENYIIEYNVVDSTTSLPLLGLRVKTIKICMHLTAKIEKCVQQQQKIYNNNKCMYVLCWAVQIKVFNSKILKTNSQRRKQQ